MLVRFANGVELHTSKEDGARLVADGIATKKSHKGAFELEQNDIAYKEIVEAAGSETEIRSAIRRCIQRVGKYYGEIKGRNRS